MVKLRPAARKLYLLWIWACTPLIFFPDTIFAVSLRGSLTRPFIFPAPHYRVLPSLPGGQLLEIPGERKVYGYYAKAGKKLVVFFHGNGEVMGSLEDIASHMLKNGFSTLLAEYPGYGYAAEYPPSEENLYTDAELLVRHVQRQFHHRAADTVLLGFSLGTGVAVELAARGAGQALLLFAPFTSMAELAAIHYTPLARLMVVDRFDNASKAKHITFPVMIVHGSHDSIVPVQHGQILAKLFPQAKLIELAGAEHNDLFGHLGEQHWREILDFCRTFRLVKSK
ncbi:MAG: lysophospholipase [Turneriella sp.]|nr:lysophospholipase [Turneriella sp.]